VSEISSRQALLTGWGRTAPTGARLVHTTAEGVASVVGGAGRRGLIARGLGRSYGDPAQNAGGTVLAPLPADIRLEQTSGLATVSAGTSLHDLIRYLVPRGFFVPVTPGTRFVTVGGAVACDIHGKNHHRSGSFGDHVAELELVTASGDTRSVAPDRDPDLYWATVGGLGLTGVITSVTLELVPVETGYLRVDTERLGDLDAVMARIEASDSGSAYSVAWIDTAARGRSMGRSVLTRGDFARLADLSGAAARLPRAVPGEPHLAAPAVVPSGLVSTSTVRAFNELWYRKAPRLRTGELQSVATFFHPLDGVKDWNRLYGRGGFVQYQFVLPDPEDGRLARILERIAMSGQPSFLAVLKRFGPGNAGLLSFPVAGWTLAVDFPVGRGLGDLLTELDREVVGGGGRLYLAKDARSSPEMVAAGYPRLDRFREARARIDPDRRFQSDLSRRLDL
jgi:decaprenylphospho-beta-D-ribofuranose 2-oxidase